MKIQNFDQLAVSDARRATLTIAEAGLEAIDTERVMRGMIRLNTADGKQMLLLGDAEKTEEIDLAAVHDIIFIAVGKCAVDAAVVVDDILGTRIARGVVVDVEVYPALKTDRIKTFCGTHPLPSEENLLAAQAIVAALANLAENDLVIFVISGGGSTLLFLPRDPASREEVTIFDMLTAAGASIEELNTVRKHISYARGGWLAKDAYPARAVSFLFSDVPTDNLSFISSGPTIKDESTIEDAAAILMKFGVLKTCTIEQCGLIETPKDEKYFARVTNILAVSNVQALETMKAVAEKLGFTTEIRDTKLSGEANDVAAMVAAALHAAPPRSVLLWGGETTVTATGKGEGGRNMQLSLAALEKLEPGSDSGEVILSLATDGRDHGPYAGALCDSITKKAIMDAHMDAAEFLKDNNSYPFFTKVGNYLMTGDTGSNVSDIIIALKE
jgi:glycerate-2-kinase